MPAKKTKSTTKKTTKKTASATAMTEHTHCGCGSVCPVSLGLSLGVVWSVGLVIFSLFAMGGNYGQPFVELLQSVYIGYEMNAIGILIGAVWGFIDAFIGGAVVAVVYNCFSKCCAQK